MVSDNVLIAEFLGYNYLVKGDYTNKKVYLAEFTQAKWTSDVFTGHYGYKFTRQFEENELLFDSSWDWIMKAVTKILKIIKEDFRYYGYLRRIHDSLLKANINSLYKVVVDFIIYYNMHLDEKI